MSIEEQDNESMKTCMNTREIPIIIEYTFTKPIHVYEISDPCDNVKNIIDNYINKDD